MKWFNGYKIRLVLFGFVAAILAGGGGKVYGDFTFGEPVNVKTVIPVLEPMHTELVCFSYDGLEMYVVSDRPGGNGDYDVWVLRRTSAEGDWGPPENLGPAVNTASYDCPGSISADGLTLYFQSDRPGGYGFVDFYVTTRATKDDPWGPAMNLGPKLNSSSWDYQPQISRDGLEFYFSSGILIGTDPIISRMSRALIGGLKPTLPVLLSLRTLWLVFLRADSCSPREIGKSVISQGRFVVIQI